MNPELTNIYLRMKEVAFIVLGRAVYDATFSEQLSPYTNTMSILEAAQGTELMLKAKIAQVHPLLIFEKLPKIQNDSDFLELDHLFDTGRTYKYSDLPNILWATTGHKINNLNKYQNFGKLRNAVIHSAHPVKNPSEETMSFLFECVDPISQELWDQSFTHYAEKFDPEIITEGYLADKIHSLELHPSTEKYMRLNDPEWGKI